MMLRKGLVALMLLAQVVVGIGTVDAQLGDPLALVASAAIQPFFSGGGIFTVFELFSLGENPAAHVFFFNASCNRIISRPFRMSAHDVLIRDTIDLGLSFNGLMAVAKSSNGITAEALEAPITIRAHRVDVAGDRLWTIDPIGAATAELTTQTWNPLRSAAQTVTFPDAGGVSTRWWLVCPRNDVVVDIGPGIPPLPPGANLIRALVYDLDEEPVLDVQFTCQCLTEILPNTLDPATFKDPRLVEMFTYLALQPVTNPPSFTGYRLISFTAGGFTADLFSRMSQMSAATLLTEVPFQGAR